MQGEMECISSAHCAGVDVRDVAQAHLLAVKKPEAMNKRYIISHPSLSFRQYADPVAEKYRPLGWPITERYQEEIPNEKITRFNNAASLELGVTYTDWNKTMVDMADKMVELGMVTKP